MGKKYIINKLIDKNIKTNNIKITLAFLILSKIYDYYIYLTKITNYPKFIQL